MRAVVRVRRPWSRAGSTASASTGRWSSPSSPRRCCCHVVGERLVACRLAPRRRSRARRRPRRSGRRSRSRSCSATSRSGSPSAPGRCRARWRRCSRRPARRAPSRVAPCGRATRRARSAARSRRSARSSSTRVPSTRVFCHERAVGLLHVPQVVEQPRRPPRRRRPPSARSRRGRSRAARRGGTGRRTACSLERQRAPDPRHVRRRDRGAAVRLSSERGEHQQRLLVERAAAASVADARGRRA